MADGNLLEFIKALYEFTTSGNWWHANLLHTLRGMGLRPTCFDLSVWIKGHEGGYDYTSIHTDDVIFISQNTHYIIEKLKDIYMIKIFGAPKFYLVCN